MKKPGQPLYNYARYTGIAFQMAAVIGLAVLGGIKLDEWIPTGFPLFTLLMCLISVPLSIYLAIKDFIKKK